MLTGQKILVAEDEVLIAFEIKASLEAAGASVVVAHRTADALAAVDDPLLSAAVVDHSLFNNKSSAIYAKMNERDLPFLIYSGYDSDGSGAYGERHLKKPAGDVQLVEAVAAAISRRP